MRRRAAAAIGLALALPLVGCGGKSDADRARDTVRGWVEALASGRGDDACQAMTDSGRHEVVQLVQLFADGPRDVDDCPRQVAHLSRRSASEQLDVEIGATSVGGERATVETEGGPNRVQLRREDGGWRVHSFLLDGWRAFGIPDYPPGARPPD
ncbi:MAG TPA: hypothetical protein VF715_05685 [Thermoleophilaceae bacterium]